MKISRNWLQTFFDDELPPVEALSDAITFHAFEIDGVESKNGDDMLDVKVTPNRGHDCLSYRGIAKEVSAILNLPLKKGADPLASEVKKRFMASPATEEVHVTLEEPSLSQRYIAGVVKGVTVGSSPAWLSARLEAMGQRSINNVVDATNYVMFMTGQPLHAFDARKLQKGDGGYHIVVRKARSGERLLALDEKVYELTDSMLVIVDGNKDTPIGIAGIKGGEPASITEQTTDLILESANFSGVSVRKTSAALKLRTDASVRFEQVLSPELAAFAMQNVVELILSIAGGEFSGYADVYPAVTDAHQPTQSARRIILPVSTLHAILGVSFSAQQIADVFTRLGFSYTQKGDEFDIEVPFERLDLTLPEDLVEEVARIVGFDAIPELELPPASLVPEVNPYFFAAEQAREELTKEGFSEVYTSVFAEEGERAVLNKVDSVRPFLRTTLLPGLEDALKKNIPNKEFLGLTEVRLFEIGVVWKDGNEVLMLGTITEKGKAEEKLLTPVAAKAYHMFSPARVFQYESFSKYPYIVRDIAMWTPEGTDSSEVEALIKKEAGELAQKIYLFDRFEKQGRVSLGFRIIFQSFERTLTEAEANDVMEKVSATLTSKGFEIR